MAPIDHEFTDARWLELAMTHSSLGRAKDNERLEFLGDTVLDLLVAEALYRAHPELNEGALTEFKAEVVSRKSLAEAAKRLELDKHVHVGPGLKARVLPRSVLANIYEALLGAIYLDSGLEKAREYVEKTLAEALSQPHHREAPSNPKQELQQISQRLWNVPPTYTIAEEIGRAHARAFLVGAVCAEREFPSAWGRTVKEAERWAAHEALLLLHAEEQPLE
jgi:ribonuclease-3